MLESNPPRNSQPETHPDDERGRWPQVQDEIARAIAEKLKVTIGVGGVKQCTKNAEAYDL